MSNPVLPIKRNGSCPSGYRQSRDMCVPNPGAKPVKDSALAPLVGVNLVTIVLQMMLTPSM